MLRNTTAVGASFPWLPQVPASARLLGNLVFGIDKCDGQWVGISDVHVDEMPAVTDLRAF